MKDKASCTLPKGGAHMQEIFYEVELTESLWVGIRGDTDTDSPIKKMKQTSLVYTTGRSPPIANDGSHGEL